MTTWLPTGIVRRNRIPPYATRTADSQSRSLG
jgi:hypothetical protein